MLNPTFGVLLLQTYFKDIHGATNIIVPLASKYVVSSTNTACELNSGYFNHDHEFSYSGNTED